VLQDMRLVFLFLALSCIAAGILFGALNPQPARVDFYWFALDGSLGLLLLGSALGGAILGGCAMLVGMVWPLQARLRRARRDAARARGNAVVVDTADAEREPDRP
jgi:putative membrane protein